MSNPKGMRAWAHALDSGAHIHVYSDDSRTILQVRRAIPTDEDVLSPSFKVAVTLSPSDALALAAELLSASSRILATQESLSHGTYAVGMDHKPNGDLAETTRSGSGERLAEVSQPQL
jgi:hypothetical protein